MLHHRKQAFLRHYFATQHSKGVVYKPYTPGSNRHASPKKAWSLLRVKVHVSSFYCSNSFTEASIVCSFNLTELKASEQAPSNEMSELFPSHQKKHIVGVSHLHTHAQDCCPKAVCFPRGPWRQCTIIFVHCHTSLIGGHTRGRLVAITGTGVCWEGETTKARWGRGGAKGKWGEKTTFFFTEQQGKCNEQMILVRQC